MLTTFLPARETIGQSSIKPLLGKKTRDSPDITLILDLDETLIHSSLLPISEHDLQLPVDDVNSTPVSSFSSL